MPVGAANRGCRVVPIVCAAATVGLLTAWVRDGGVRRPASPGGLVLAANPMFADLGRSVHGYSLMVLGCTVATMVLVDADRRPGAMTRKQSAVYVVALGVAIGTQFYAVLVLAAHLGDADVATPSRPGLATRVEAVVVIGALPYAAMLRALYESARNRSGTFQPGFPFDVARAVLGQQYPRVAVLAALTIYALSVARIRRPLLPGAAVVAVALLAIWIVLHPLDLYPRFVVWLVPAVALAAAAAIARNPRFAPVAMLAIVAMAVSQASSWTTDPIASRQVARMVESTRAQGQTPCAVGYASEVILGYTRRARSVFTVSQLAGCDLLFADAGTSGVEIRRLSCHFEQEAQLAGLTHILVFTDPETTTTHDSLRGLGIVVNTRQAAASDVQRRTRRTIKPTAATTTTATAAGQPMKTPATTATTASAITTHQPQL